MNLIQLEYLVALHQEKHFTKAAERCHVTQPTLSMQIKSLEQELGVQLFDRSHNPIITSDLGVLLVAEAEEILARVLRIRQFSMQAQSQTEGQIRLGIIPTLAPYLLPRFLPRLLAKHCKVQVVLTETPTKNILSMLAQNQLDAALLVGPFESNQFASHTLFFEEFYAYLSPKDPQFANREIDISAIDSNRILVLEEGHCFTNQVFRLCSLGGGTNAAAQLQYLAGSFETIKKLVDQNLGLTFLPELASMDLGEDDQEGLKRLKGTAPVRQVDLLVRNGYTLPNIIEALKTEIQANIPLSMQRLQDRVVVPV